MPYLNLSLSLFVCLWPLSIIQLQSNFYHFLGLRQDPNYLQFGSMGSYEHSLSLKQWLTNERESISRWLKKNKFRSTTSEPLEHIS
jgi:hypothetical protein